MCDNINKRAYKDVVKDGEKNEINIDVFYVLNRHGRMPTTTGRKPHICL